MNPENQNEPTLNPEPIEQPIIAQPVEATPQPTYFSTNTMPNNVAPAVKKNNQKILMLIVVGVVVLLLVGTGAYFLLKPKATTTTANSNTNSSSSTNKTGSVKKLTAKEAADQIYNGKWYEPMIGNGTQSWTQFSGGSSGGTLQAGSSSTETPLNGTFSINGINASIIWGDKLAGHTSAYEPEYYDSKMFVVNIISSDGLATEQIWNRDAQEATNFGPIWASVASLPRDPGTLDKAFYESGALDPANNLLP